MPVLSVRPEERRLIPYEVQALYELGRISKEQLDNYIKTGSEEYLKQHEAAQYLDPNQFVGNLAAPVKEEAPWPDSKPAEYGALNTLKDTGVALQTGAVSGLVGLGNLAAQGLSTQGEWAGRFMEATGLPQVGKPLREFSETYGDVASRETGAFREALQGVASERKSEGLKQSEQALAELLGSNQFKNMSAVDQAASVARFIGSNKKLAAYMAAESAGGLASGGPLAKAANILRGSSLASNVAARLAGGGILAGQELAGIQSDVYNTVYQETGDSEKASKAASTASTDPLVLLAAGIDVFTGAEATSLITGAQKAARRATRPTLTSLMAAAGKPAVTEAAGEFLQEGAQARAENIAMGRPAMEGVAGQATLGALVGAPMGAAIGGASNIAEISQQNADVEARVKQGQAIYENIAKGGADIATLAEARTAIARSLGLDADTIEDAQTLANRFKEKDVPSKVRAKTVAETILTGDPAFDAGQKAAQQTFELADQFKAGAVTFGTDGQQTTKPVEATVTQFEPLQRRPATPIQGNLGSFTVEAPVAKERLSERGLKKANQRFDKDTRILDSEIANLRSQIKNNVVPAAGVNLQAQLAEAESLREGIARERLRVAEKAKPAEPTPYAKEMRRFQETKPTVEVNAQIPQAPKISRAENITNKVTEEVTAKTKKELSEDTKRRVAKVAGLVENELTFSGALRGLDDNAATEAVLAKTREYLASGEKESDIEARVTEIRKKRKADFEAFAKETSSALKNQDEVLKTLDRNLGKDVVDGLIRSDKVRVLSDFQRAEFARTQEERDSGQGVYIDKDGVIYLNAANLNKKNDKGIPLKRELAMAVLAHEQGHTKNFRTEDGKRVPVLKGLAGDAAYDALNKAIADAAKGTGRIADIAKRAQDRAKAGVESAQKAGRQVELKDELPQYFVEELMNSYDGPLGQFRKFIDSASARARDIINRSPLKMDIRPQDIGWMVKQDLIAESKTPKTTGTKSAKLSYAGEKSAVADKGTLQKAKDMLSAGKSMEDIRSETGWFLNQWDGAWRFEVSDKDAKLKITFKDIPESELLGETNTLLLKEVLDHPTLFENYPELENVEFIKRIGFFDFGTLQGWYNDEQNRIGITPYAKDPLGTLLHEIQHWIQGVEGFGTGGNESSAFASLPNEAKAALAADALKQTETSLESDISARDAYTTTLNNRDLLALAGEALSLRDNRDLPFLEKVSSVNQISNRVKSVLGEGFGANEVVKYMHYGFHKDMDGFKQDFERRAKQATESAAKNMKTLTAIKSGDTAALLEVLKRTGKAYKFYRSLLGEIEARDVTNRKDLDVGDRVVTSPYEKTMIEDSINPSDVIVVKEPRKGRVNLSLGTREATGFEEAKKQGKTFTSPATGEEVFEIPDSDMKVNAGIIRAAKGKPIDLEMALVHDELFKQWPFLRKDVKIKLSDKFALNEAEYEPTTKTITISNQNIENIYNPALSSEARKEARKDIAKTVLHEVTHAIQDKIGAEMGSNPTFEMYAYILNKLNKMSDAKIAAEYNKVLSAVIRNRKGVDKLFDAISKLREQWEAKGKKWPDTYTDLDIHIANDPALAGQIMPFVKGLGLKSLKDLHETYNFIRQAKNAGYFSYMANRGEVTARAVALVFDGKFDTLQQAEEAVAKQFNALGTQKDSTATFAEFEKQAKEEKIKPAVLMSLGDTIEVDGKARPTTNSKGQPIADSAESARNFWRWFGDSKVVDAQGRPLVVYHGTRADFEEFSGAFAGAGMGGEARDGFFFTSDHYEASTYVGGSAPGGRVMPVFVALRRPAAFEFTDHGISDIIDADAKIAAMLRKSQTLLSRLRGTDGLLLKDIGGVKGKHLVVAFRPEQIKSVNNSGTWSKEDPRILFSLADDVKERAQETGAAAKEKAAVAWKYLQGALWDMRPAKFKISEEMRDGYVRYIEQKGREMVQQMVDAANRDGITSAELTEAWLQAQESGVLGDTDSAKVNSMMQAMRDEIDSFSALIDQVYDESGSPLSEKMKETFNKNLFKYISRSFEIDFDKQWGKKLLKAARKNPDSPEAQVISGLRDWLNNEIVVNLESLELLDDKEIKKLHKRLIDEDNAGKTRESMVRDLERFKGQMKSEEIVDVLQNDILRLSKVSGIGSYYRGAARDEGILQKKTRIPKPILAAMGERTGAAESFLTTIVRQGTLYAQTKMLADFRKAMPEAFTEEQTPENTVRIENKQGKYGPLAGLYTTPMMKQYIEERVTQHERAEDLLFNLHSAYAQEAAKDKIIDAAGKVLSSTSGAYKVWAIMTNTMNYLFNVVNGAASLARYNTLGTVYGMDYVDKDGNAVPVYKWFPELAADFLWRGSVTGTSSHELYGLAITANFVGSAMSGDIKEAFLDTIRETVQGKKPSRIKSAWRKATWLADAWFSGPEALPNILGAVVESNYLRQLWTEQGKDFTHDELMAAAADRVKRNAISRDRAIPAAKFLDRFAAQAFMTFFSETARAPMQTAYDVAMDLKASRDPALSPKARRMMQGHAISHIAGVAAAAGTIYAITQAVGSIFGHPFGAEDDEDPEGLDEEYRDRPEDLIVIGTDKDGRKLVFDLSKLNTYSLLTNVVKEIAEGNYDAAAGQAKSFLFANPLPQKIWTELTDNYGEVGKSDVATKINNSIAGTPLGQVADPTTVNELVKVMSMFNPGFIKDPMKALENADGLQENMALGFVGIGARPITYQPVKTLRYKMGAGLDELEIARSELNAAMRTKNASEELIKQEMRRYYNAERDLILKNRPLVQAALKNDISTKELRQLFKFLGANKHLNEQMLSNKPYKPTPMHKNWLTMSEKLATLGEPPKVKEEQGMIYTQNKAAYRKLFKEIYEDKE